MYQTGSVGSHQKVQRVVDFIEIAGTTCILISMYVKFGTAGDKSTYKHTK